MGKIAISHNHTHQDKTKYMKVLVTAFSVLQKQRMLAEMSETQSETGTQRGLPVGLLSNSSSEGDSVHRSTEARQIPAF